MNIENVLNRCLKHKVIVNCEHQPYLYRWYVFQTSCVALFIHKFVKSDEDRALHDHPWNFLVIPIWRGYIEHSHRDLSSQDFQILEVLEDRETQGMTIAARQAFMEGKANRRRRVWPLISARFRKAEYRHRVELIDGKPSWSLFFRFTNRRVWGFWPREGFIAWNKWWQDKCE